MMRNIAVIITVYNRIDKTIACLDAVFSQREKYHFFNVDVYLTDDGSTDDTLKILQPRFSKEPLSIMMWIWYCRTFVSTTAMAWNCWNG